MRSRKRDLLGSNLTWCGDHMIFSYWVTNVFFSLSIIMTMLIDIFFFLLFKSMSKLIIFIISVWKPRFTSIWISSSFLAGSKLSCLSNRLRCSVSSRCCRISYSFFWDSFWKSLSSSLAIFFVLENKSFNAMALLVSVSSNSCNARENVTVEVNFCSPFSNMFEKSLGSSFS